MTKKLKVTLGDFELMQILMTALGFENCSQATSVNKKVYKKDNVDILITRNT